MYFILVLALGISCSMMPMSYQSSFSLSNLPMNTQSSDQIRAYCSEHKCVDFCDLTGLDKILGSRNLSVNTTLFYLESALEEYSKSKLMRVCSLSNNPDIDIPHFLSFLYGANHAWSPLFTIMINEHSHIRKNDRQPMFT